MNGLTTTTCRTVDRNSRNQVTNSQSPTQWSCKIHPLLLYSSKLQANQNQKKKWDYLVLQSSKVPYTRMLIQFLFWHTQTSYNHTIFSYTIRAVVIISEFTFGYSHEKRQCSFFKQQLHICIYPSSQIIIANCFSSTWSFDFVVTE